MGNNIIRLLEKNGENEIRALLLPSDNAKALKNLKCSIYRGDVTNKDSLDIIFDVPSGAELYVIHCAAVVYIKSRYNPTVYRVNVDGTKNIAEKCIEKNAKLVYVSSVHAIPEKPDNGLITEVDKFYPEKVEGQYAKTKAEAANYILEMTKEKGLDACIVHPSGIIGPNDFGRSHLTQLIVDFANGRLKACVNGGYDFADVRDIADGIIKACEKGSRGECYILSNRYVTVKELMDTVSVAAHIGKIKHTLPLWLAKMTAPLSEAYYALLKQPPLYTKYSLYTLCSNSNFSNAKAKRELGYHTRAIYETIKDTVVWLREQGRIDIKYRPHKKLAEKRRRHKAI